MGEWVFQHLSWRNPTNPRMITKILHIAAVGVKYSNRLEVIVEHLHHITGLRQNFAILY